MKYLTSFLICLILVLTSCTPQSSVEIVKAGSERLEKQETIAKDNSSVSEADAVKSNVMVPADEELDDVVNDLEQDLESIDLDSTYEDLSSDDFGL